MEATLPDYHLVTFLLLARSHGRFMPLAFLLLLWLNLSRSESRRPSDTFCCFWNEQPMYHTALRLLFPSPMRQGPRRAAGQPALRDRMAP
jgi:hypothetical protein